MITRGAMRLARSMISHIGPRYYSTMRPVTGNEAGIGVIIGASIDLLHENSIKGFEKTVVMRVRHFSTMYSRNTSTMTFCDKEQNEQNGQRKVENGGAEVSATAPSSGGGSNNKDIVSYWGIQPPKVTKEDGTLWRWNCFMVRKFYFHFLTFTYIYLILNLLII